MMSLYRKTSNLVARHPVLFWVRHILTCSEEEEVSCLSV